MKLKAVEHSFINIDFDIDGTSRFICNDDPYIEYILEIIDAEYIYPLGGRDIINISEFLAIDVNDLKTLAYENDCRIQETYDYLYIFSDSEALINNLIKILEPWELAARMKYGI